MMRLRERAAVLLVALLATACGAAGPVGNADLGGDWSGTWASSTTSTGGVFTAALTQSGVFIAGAAVLASSPCFTSFIVGGTVSGNSFSLTLSTGDVRRATVAGTISGSNMSATYVILSTGTACDGDRGTITASRP